MYRKVCNTHGYSLFQTMILPLLCLHVLEKNSFLVFYNLLLISIDKENFMSKQFPCVTWKLNRYKLPIIFYRYTWYEKKTHSTLVYYVYCYVFTKLSNRTKRMRGWTVYSKFCIFLDHYALISLGQFLHISIVFW